MTENAAESLQGHTLENGWEVVEKIEKSPSSTGSFFSVCYKVKKGSELCFLKALNFGAFFSNNNGRKDVAEVIREMLNIHKYEKDLSRICQDNHASKISFVKESGEIHLNGYSIGIVPYLIFDLADGDIRNNIEFTNIFDYTWKLKSLHEVAVGIQQLHSLKISHQDIKPSNILLFNENTKIGDLGRALCIDLKSPYDDLSFSGDCNYAPPEILYNYYENDWKKRTYAIDTYLLGSLIVFYFTGLSMNALLTKNLDFRFHRQNWTGTFNEIKDYLSHSFYYALDEFTQCIELDFLKIELRNLVEQLCNPNPTQRGHKKELNTNAQFSLERFVTKLDVLYNKTFVQLSRLNHG